MKLRSLTLSNVRKFAGQSAAITGIGDGVTVISEANEFGKSTFFDALHALFFVKYGAATREVKSLQPRAGGAVRVTAGVDLPQGHFTIEKSFLQQKRAVVRDAQGTLIAQDDEAEAWIARLMDRGLEGPAGLLWVRQGTTALEPQGSSGAEKTEKERLLGARRDLLSSVAGEIDMVTGGQRMDRVIKRAEAALSVLATASGQARAKGPWKEAEQEAERLGARKAELEEACAALSTALQRRREVVGQLEALLKPDAQAARQAAFDAAEAADRAARAHAERRAQAQTQMRLRKLELDAAQTALSTLLAQAEAYGQTRAALETAQAAHREAEATKRAAEQRADTTKAALQQADAQRDAAKTAWEAAQQGALFRNAVEKFEALDQKHAQALEKRAALDRERARLVALPVTPDLLNRIEHAHARWRAAEAEAASAGVLMQIEYDGTLRITSGDTPLEAGPHAIRQLQRFDVPGIGTLTLDPGAAAADLTALTQARSALDAVLAEAAVPDLDAARDAARLRQDAVAQITLLDTIVQTLAPEGIDALGAARAKAQQALDGASPADRDPHTEIDMGAVRARLDDAERVAQEARAADDTARAALGRAQTAVATARAEAVAAEAQADQAAAAYGCADTFSARQSDAARAQVVAQEAWQAARDLDETLGRDAPDADTAAADLARARSAQENARRRGQQLSEERAVLNATIRERAEQGVEETLAEVTGRHSAATDRAARFAHEAAALKLLLDTLKDTRGAAQEAYFGPVQAELAPLLSILHADAALSFDPASLLPQALRRDGAGEALEVLSGGTQEQIAILTRLAFARLFAKQGRPMPIILDDALVYSDDARIVKMFTALHRVAVDQQVIVFSCRQMAFEALGGDRPQVDITPIA